MSLTGAEFLVREAAVNIRRNGVTTLATVSTVTISLAVVGAFFVALFAVTRLAGSWTRRLEIAVFVAKGTQTEERLAIQDRIEAMPYVTNCDFIPKEDAWPKFKRQLGFSGDDDLGGIENPLVDAFRVKVSSAREIIPTASKIRRLEHIDAVREWATAAKRLVAISDYIKLGGLTVGILLAAAMLAVIGNTLKLTMFSRRREISIMQLVGATDTYIRIPFVIEGAFHGAVGGAAATGIVWLGYRFATQTIERTAPFLERFYAGLPAMTLFVGLVGFGLAIGFGGTLLAMRSFLLDRQMI
jgi:cell division transport system permease protein